MHFKQKLPNKTFQSALAYFRTHAFDVQGTPGVAGQIQIRKFNCGVMLAPTADGSILHIGRPGCLVGGEIATLIDRGYQKFLVTSRFQVSATADRLRSLHAFQEELNEAAGTPEYYNLALGTVSDLYLYDRLKGRDTEARTTAESH